MLHQIFSPARRSNLRVETPEGVWVYWQCCGREDTSQVLNLSVGGLFVKTSKPVVVGAKSQIEFLVQEGSIRAEAIVQHVNPRRGAGLKFTAIREGDRAHLATLLHRLGSSRF